MSPDYRVVATSLRGPFAASRPVAKLPEIWVWRFWAPVAMPEIIAWIASRPL